jgi:hypothetical protein
MRPWITPEEALPYTPWRSVKTIYDRIREGKFPFEVRRAGRKILISSKDLGLITTANEETQAGESQAKQVLILK